MIRIQREKWFSYPASCIKSETCGHLFALQISINCFGATNYPGLQIFTSDHKKRYYSTKHTRETTKTVKNDTEGKLGQIGSPPLLF